MLFDNQTLLHYQVGGLLYTPAINTGIADKIHDNRFQYLSSLALCLEDSIKDEALEEAEQTLVNTLSKMIRIQESGSNLPLIFVRVRNPAHLQHVHDRLGDMEFILTGYILPKFDLQNAEQYFEAADKIERHSSKHLHYMPILESGMVANLRTRLDCLTKLKDFCDARRNSILNIRVGGTDLCNYFGVRRRENQSIYDIGAVRDILSDIINVFSCDYIVSAPVWEYFGSDYKDAWNQGLKKELELDAVNGFIGKTAIHPSQLKTIYESLAVSKRDYEDAQKIMNWSDSKAGAAKNEDGSRMNEVKCHYKWAERILVLAKVYGIRSE